MGIISCKIILPLVSIIFSHMLNVSESETGFVGGLYELKKSANEFPAKLAVPT